MTRQPRRREVLGEGALAPLVTTAKATPRSGWDVVRRAPPTLQAHIIETVNERLASAIELAAAVKLAHRQLAGDRTLRSAPLIRELNAVLDGYVDALAARITQLGGVRAPVRAALRAPGHATLSVRASDGPPRSETLQHALGELGDLQPGERLVRGALGPRDRAEMCAAVTRAVYHWLWCVEATTPPPAPRRRARTDPPA